MTAPERIGETRLAIPTLAAGDLVLRAPLPSDFEAYAAFRGSERARVLGGPFSRAQAFDQLAEIAGHWHLRGFGRFVVADAVTGAPLGIVGPYFPEGWPEPEIAWSVFDGAEGRGIARRAAEAARAWAYAALGWRTAISAVAPGNARSRVLAERLGCRVEGRFEHPEAGTLDIWRHPSAAELAA